MTLPIILRVWMDGRVERLSDEVVPYLQDAPVAATTVGKPSFRAPAPWAKGQTTPPRTAPARVTAPARAPAPPTRVQRPLPAAPAPAEPAYDDDGYLREEESIGELEMAEPAPPEVVAEYFGGGPPPPQTRNETPEQRERRIQRYRRPVPPRPGVAIEDGIELR